MSLTIQLQTMLSMITMGVWLGASLDTYGKLLYQPRSFSWIVAIRDFLFWCIQALLVFYVLYQSNLGELRFYVFAALLCGYAVYRSLLQTVYNYVLDRLIAFVLSIIRFIKKSVYYIIVKPIKWILNLALSFCMIVLTIVWKICLVLSSVVWKPLWWLFRPIARWIGGTKQWQKVMPFLTKIKEVGRSVWKKKDKR
ncbi:spore cortex biosynthesis protein YabQ [Alkalicoccobacillus murimartini]|uniref:Spore cortex biosynthesis protein YabQ n=1 Tax=Alkalicoccobacillus murimartini TaxID=171685 RepID=A0ABT9YN78_9BACI|nr:spore cortex biosynthesis protein YabQ [Alkalicoccobacillus murimartini]MDQ0209216.1 spore cortex biosynthesis protein YabQ [Alkalicoccobacillus murimartini]